MTKTIQINLLPWRVLQLQQAKKRKRVLALVFIVLGLMLIAMALDVIRHSQRHESQSHQALQLKIKQADEEILKWKRHSNMHLRMLMLIKDQRLLMHFLNEVPKLMPKGLYLTSLKRRQSSVVLKGQAIDSSQIIQLLTNAQSSPWASLAQLQPLENTQGLERGLASNIFTLSLKMQYPSKQVAKAISL